MAGGVPPATGPARAVVPLRGAPSAGPDPSYVPLSVGPGRAYRPPAGARASGPPCAASRGPRLGVHVELFANRLVIVVPAGIGVVGGRRRGAYVRGGRCFYPLATLEPTGVVELGRAARPLRLGDLFAIWGQRLSASRLAGFGGGRVRAYVGGRAVGGDPRAVVLRAHQEIVLEIGGYVPPHRSYAFAAGL